ncbi:MAG: WD40 repeat domain-containing protein, partial [Phycisphaerales bacterium]
MDATSGRVRYTCPSVWFGPVQSIRFSPDGRTLAICAATGALSLWEADRWEPIRKFETGDISAAVTSVTSAIAWAPDNRHIARADNRQRIVEIIDLNSGHVQRVLSGNADKITSISWSPDGGFIATGTLDGKIHVWELESDSEAPSVTLGAHLGAVSLIDWIPESQSLVTTGLDGMIEIWERSDGSLTNRIERQTDSITCAALSRDGSVLSTGSPDGIIRLWNTRSGWTSNLFRIDPNDVDARQSTFTAVAWSPDGQLLAWGDSTGKIRIWNLGSRQWQRSFLTACGSISSLAWSADGRGLLCGGSDGKVRIWDAKDDFQEHVVLLPLWGPVGPGIAVSAAGDYRGPPGLADHVVYIAQTAEAQVTLSPADFKSQ